MGAGVLFVLGLLWLAATMWSARASFNGDADDPTVVVSSAALVLPGVVVATLMAGAAAGLAGVSRFARPVAPAPVPSWAACSSARPVERASGSWPPQ